MYQTLPPEQMAQDCASPSALGFEVTRTLVHYEDFMSSIEGSWANPICLDEPREALINISRPLSDEELAAGSLDVHYVPSIPMYAPIQGILKYLTKYSAVCFPQVSFRRWREWYLKPQKAASEERGRRAGCRSSIADLAVLHPIDCSLILHLFQHHNLYHAIGICLAVIAVLHPLSSKKRYK